jgi:hypothetical protein
MGNKPENDQHGQGEDQLLPEVRQGESIYHCLDQAGP